MPDFEWLSFSNQTHLGYDVIKLAWRSSIHYGLKQKWQTRDTCYRETILQEKKTKPNLALSGFGTLNADKWVQDYISRNCSASRDWKRKTAHELQRRTKLHWQGVDTREERKIKNTPVRKMSNVQFIRFIKCYLILIHFGLYNLARPRARETLLWKQYVIWFECLWAVWQGAGKSFY